MSEPSTPSFQGMCHFIGQLSKASKTGMRAALADCPKCHFNMLEACCTPSTVTERTVPFMSPTCPGDPTAAAGGLARAAAHGAGRHCGAGTGPRRPPQNAGAHHPQGVRAVHQCEQALRNYFASVLARLEPEQAAQMDALRGALMDAILAENAARNIDPKGETNHDKDL